jgi:hypothetical protein
MENIEFINGQWIDTATLKPVATFEDIEKITSNKIDALRQLKERLNIQVYERTKELESKKAIKEVWNYTKNKNNRTSPQNH